MRVVGADVEPADIVAPGPDESAFGPTPVERPPHAQSGRGLRESCDEVSKGQCKLTAALFRF